VRGRKDHLESWNFKGLTADNNVLMDVALIGERSRRLEHTKNKKGGAKERKPNLVYENILLIDHTSNRSGSSMHAIIYFC